MFVYREETKERKKNRPLRFTLCVHNFIHFTHYDFQYFLQNFREQCIDGAGLPMLTEDHLMHSLGMKLGPALKLRSVLAKKLGGPCPCVSCTLSINATSPSGSIPRPSSAESGT